MWWGEDGKIVGSKGVKLKFLREEFIYVEEKKSCGGLDFEVAERQAEVQKEWRRL